MENIPAAGIEDNFDFTMLSTPEPEVFDSPTALWGSSQFLPIADEDIKKGELESHTFSLAISPKSVKKTNDLEPGSPEHNQAIVDEPRTVASLFEEHTVPKKQITTHFHEPSTEETIKEMQRELTFLAELNSDLERSHEIITSNTVRKNEAACESIRQYAKEMEKERDEIKSRLLAEKEAHFLTQKEIEKLKKRSLLNHEDRDEIRSRLLAEKEAHFLAQNEIEKMKKRPLLNHEDRGTEEHLSNFQKASPHALRESSTKLQLHVAIPKQEKDNLASPGSSIDKFEGGKADTLEGGFQPSQPRRVFHSPPNRVERKRDLSHKVFHSPPRRIEKKRDSPHKVFHSPLGRVERKREIELNKNSDSVMAYEKLISDLKRELDIANRSAERMGTEKECMLKKTTELQEKVKRGNLLLVKKGEELMEMGNELKVLRDELSKSKRLVMDRNHQIDLLNNKLLKNKSINDDLRKSQSNLETTVDGQKLALKDLELERKTLQKKFDALSRENVKLDQVKDNLARKIKDQNWAIERSEDANRTLTSNLRECKKTNGEHLNKIRLHINNFEKSRDQCRKLQEENAAMKERFAVERNDLERVRPFLEEKVRKESAKNQRCQQDSKRLENRLHDALEEARILRHQLQESKEMNSSRRDSSAEIANLRDHIRRIEKENKKLRNNPQASNEENTQRLRERLQRFEEENEELRQNLDSVMSNSCGNEEQISSLKQEAARARRINEEMNAKMETLKAENHELQLDMRDTFRMLEQAKWKQAQVKERPMHHQQSSHSPPLQQNRSLPSKTKPTASHVEIMRQNVHNPAKQMYSEDPNSLKLRSQHSSRQSPYEGRTLSTNANAAYPVPIQTSPALSPNESVMQPMPHYGNLSPKRSNSGSLSHCDFFRKNEDVNSVPLPFSTRGRQAPRSGMMRQHLQKKSSNKSDYVEPLRESPAVGENAPFGNEQTKLNIVVEMKEKRLIALCKERTVVSDKLRKLPLNPKTMRLRNEKKELNNELIKLGSEISGIKSYLRGKKKF